MIEIKKPKRVLHVVSAMERGGAETLLMNVYRKVDKTKIQFDFVSHVIGNCIFDDEIISMGGRILKVPSLGQVGPAAYLKQLKKIMCTDEYVAVHSHTDYQCGFPALAAKLVGIPRRICHSHSNYFPRGKGLKEIMILKALQTLIRYSATEYAACSREAAKFLFGQRFVEHGKVRLLRNGIEVSEFININNDSQASLKRELNIPHEAKIIGHIGKFSESKNHVFLLKVLKRMDQQQKNVVAILVGDGPLRSKVEQEAKELGIFDRIRFLGVRTDIPRLVKAFDVFLFPSLFEGFGIVILEAQSAGTPCVVSDRVPRNTDMGLGLVSFISLKDNLDTWSRVIEEAFVKERPDNHLIHVNFSELGFNIQTSIPEWLKLYG